LSAPVSPCSNAADFAGQSGVDDGPRLSGPLSSEVTVTVDLGQRWTALRRAYGLGVEPLARTG
jgi:hypothetical protein